MLKFVQLFQLFHVLLIDLELEESHPFRTSIQDESAQCHIRLLT